MMFIYIPEIGEIVIFQLEKVFFKDLFLSIKSH